MAERAQRSLRVLLSAYACEPNKGSEPGVGWHFAIEAARLGHEVWVLTRANNRESIEKGLQTLSGFPNLHFLYYDLPSWARWWKKGDRGIHLYYLLWQWGAYRYADSISKCLRVDCVHHVTFVSARQPSFMGNLGVPFIFGPVAGGERAPWRLRFSFGWRGWIKDMLRDIANLIVRVDPAMWLTFSQANRIFVTSEQTQKMIPNRYWHKVSTRLAIGVEEPANIEYKRSARNQFRVLYVGRFLHLKGLALGLFAFARCLEKIPDSKLTLIGEGPEEKPLRKLVVRLGISSNVNWVQWARRSALEKFYNDHDVFLFPSLHDSGGMVVLEAMSHGMPVVCLDLGGPGYIVDSSCGRVINTARSNRVAVIDGLCAALIALGEDQNLCGELGRGAVKRCRDFEWKETVQEIYGGVGT